VIWSRRSPVRSKTRAGDVNLRLVLTSLFRSRELKIALIVCCAAAACRSTPAIKTAPTAERCGLPEKIREPHWPRELSHTSSVEKLPPPPGTSTIVLLPDTQYYAFCEYPHLKHQSDWIWAERTNRNITAAVTLGDLTDRNTRKEWEFVNASYGPLLQGFPLLLTTGNHDLGQDGSAEDRTSLLSQYFPETWARGSGTLREVMTPGAVDNAFYSLELGKVRVGVLMLEWSPRRETVAWANQILSRYADHRVIVATHAYLYYDGTRYDYVTRGEAQEWNPLSYGTAKNAGAGDCNHDGEMLWNALLRLHPNVFLVVSGHVLANGTGLLTSQGDAGNTVHQLLVNYQMLDEGGLGYLRLLEVLPDGRTLRIKTFSPSLGLFSYAPDQDLALNVEPPLFDAAAVAGRRSPIERPGDLPSQCNQGALLRQTPP
jgi:hypothetical protein